MRHLNHTHFFHTPLPPDHHYSCKAFYHFINHILPSFLSSLSYFVFCSCSVFSSCRWEVHWPTPQACHPVLALIPTPSAVQHGTIAARGCAGTCRRCRQTPSHPLSCMQWQAAAACLGACTAAGARAKNGGGCLATGACNSRSSADVMLQGCRGFAGFVGGKRQMVHHDAGSR